MHSYGSVIRRARQERGLSLVELADKAGTNKGYISGIETESVSPPAPRLSMRLAKALGLDPKDLLRRAWVEKAPREIRSELMALLFPSEFN